MSSLRRRDNRLGSTAEMTLDEPEVYYFLVAVVTSFRRQRQVM